MRQDVINQIFLKNKKDKTIPQIAYLILSPSTRKSEERERMILYNIFEVNLWRSKRERVFESCVDKVESTPAPPMIFFSCTAS